MIPLPASFDNSAAATFCDEVRGIPLTEDAHFLGEGVERISTLAVQVLLSLDIALKQNGHKLIIDKPSKDMVDVFQDIGLGDVLRGWSGQ